MASLSLMFSKRDYVSLTQWLLTQAAWFVPNGPYQTDFYEVVSDLSGVTTWMRDGLHMYVCRDNYFKVPLEMRRTEAGIHAGKYFIMPREGGPTILVGGAYNTFQEGLSEICGGDVSYWPTFWNYRDETYEPVPIELKSFYREIADWIRRNSLKFSVARQVYWIGMDAVKQLQQGYEFVFAGWEDPKKVLGRLREQNTTKKFESFVKQDFDVSYDDHPRGKRGPA